MICHTVCPLYAYEVRYNMGKVFIVKQNEVIVCYDKHSEVTVS